MKFGKVPFELRYHPDVRSIDIPLLDAKMKIRMKNAIETRLTTAPHLFAMSVKSRLEEEVLNTVFSDH
jgi:mRNA interferase RelE/StbE